jgi:hypothetical protein
MDGVRAKVVVEVLCYKPEDRGFDLRSQRIFFSIYAIPSAALDPWDLLSLYQK